MADQHSTHSTLRERVVEHVFVGEALRTLWRWGVVDVEVLRSEFDAHGYDLIMARRRVVRHIQFKTGTSKRPCDVSVSRALAAKPSGCVIWIHVSPELEMGPYFWFGGSLNQPLPSIEQYESPLRATHNKQGERPPRQNHRLVPGDDFEEVKDFDDLLARLLGEFRYELRVYVASELSAAELETCSTLVKNGGAVRGDCKEKLRNASELVVVRCHDEVVGFGAIKGVRADYASKIAQRSHFAFSPDTSELGYVAVHGTHQGYGLSERIVAQLLRDKKTTPCFATTDNRHMASTLSRAGFVRKGDSWPGDRGQLTLWLRNFR
ncbi:MAG: hypothetical protein QOK37_4698 [Thermoanaerobaculia bacterium]|jgi:GNAT superfamily N-acetyltransferase|nr:hypothetical protein [Thermoanaerobaculia bacterium]